MSAYGSFRFDYRPGILRYGNGVISELSDELNRLGYDRALVVSGSTVGTTPEVIERVERGLGEQLGGVFAQTTPGKRISTAYRGVEQMEDVGADVIVAVGGGSTLDVAKAMRCLRGSGQSLEEATRQIQQSGSIEIPEGPLAPVIAVPTTLAGADLSIVAGLRAGPEGGILDEQASGGIGSPRLMPDSIVYDPELFATTPKPILTASAMNGFDKGLESMYANCATPITDATAMRGLRLLAEGLIEFGEANSHNVELLGPVVRGIMLVQYGIAQPTQTTMALIHAFGHGLTRNYDVQQGAAHGVLAPPVLEYIFERVEGRRELLAEGLGMFGVSNPARAVVEKVSQIRDALGLPSRLRDIEGPSADQFDRVIDTVMGDAFMENNPNGLEPTRAEIQKVLENAY